MGSKENNRRSIVLISRKFQLFQILKFILVNFELMFVCGAVVYFFLLLRLEGMRLGEQVLSPIKETLLPLIIILFLAAFVLSSAIIAVFVLYSSHKIAGPLYRFRTALADMREGNLHPMLDLREHDELRPIAETMKELCGSLSGDLARARELAAGLPADSSDRARDLEEILARWTRA